MSHPGSPSAGTVSGFKIIELLGEGGFGSVYLARQESTGQLVALKLQREGAPRRSSSRDDERFEREARLCAELRHPHIVQLLDKGRSQDGRLFAVYEYVPGQTLKKYIGQRGALSAPEAGDLMTQVLDALVCAHAHGIVHRDLKPQNIMVSATGARPMVKVLDFGIGALIPSARDERYESLTLTNEMIGTPAYSAPEQLRGHAPTIRTDLYVWALVFLECLTGAPAVSGGSVAETFHRQLSPAELPLPPAIVGHPLGALLRRALKKDAGQRYASAQALWNELQVINLTNLVGQLGPEPERLRRPSPAPQTTQTMGAEVESQKHPITVLCCALPPVFAGDRGVEHLEPELERLEARLRGQINDCVDVATRFGGYVVGTLADRLLVYFGHPVASDSDTPRALRAAIEIQHLFQGGADRPRAGGRIGLHAGLTVMGAEALSTGVTSSIAMWLENLAPPGEILVSEVVRRRLAGTSEFAPVGAGGPAIGCYRYVGPSRPAAHAPTSVVEQRPMIGRRAELDAASLAWRSAQRGEGALLLVSGEAGIGKSRLVQDLRQRVAPASWSCRCLPEQMNSALFPVLELMRSVLDLPRRAPGLDARGRLERALEAAGVDLARAMPIFCAWLALPEAGYGASPLAPPLQRAEILAAVAAWILTRAARQPLLLVIEDLHWIDPMTAELLERLAGVVHEHALLVVATARPELANPWGARARVIGMARLDRADIERMAAQVRGGPPLAAEVLQLIAQRTDGIPLFVEELTRMLLDTHLVEVGGLLALKAGTDLSTIPTSIRDSLVGRIARLGAASQTAQLAAAIGREFTRELLVAAALPSRQDAERDLASLQEADLVTRRLDGHREYFQFRHALIRDAAYEMLTSTGRRRVHKQISDALEQHFADTARTDPALFARHHAAAGQHEPAAAYGIAATRLAATLSQNDAAITHGGAALEHIAQCPAEARAELELTLNGILIPALMARHGWGDERVRDKVERSQRVLGDLGESKHRFPTLCTLTFYHHVAGNRHRARTTAQALLDTAIAARDVDGQVMARTLLGQCRWIDGDYVEGEQILMSAVELYQPELHGEHSLTLGLDTRVWATASLGQLRWFTGEADLARACVRDAIAWAEDLEIIATRGLAHFYAALVSQYAGDKPGTRAAASRAIELAEQYGLPAIEGYCRILRFWAEDDAESAAPILSALEQMGCRLGLDYYGSLAAQTLMERGELAAALQQLEACLARSAAMDQHYYEPELHLRAALCKLHLPEAQREAQRESARESLRAASQMARRQGMFRSELDALIEELRHFGPTEGARQRVVELAALRPQALDGERLAFAQAAGLVRPRDAGTQLVSRSRADSP